MPTTTFVHGAWCDYANLLDFHQPQGGNQDTTDAKLQRIYLNHYFVLPVRSVAWQDANLRQY